VGEAGPDPRTGYTGARPGEGRARVTWFVGPADETAPAGDAPMDPTVPPDGPPDEP
jgi:hypothetical protein